MNGLHSPRSTALVLLLAACVDRSASPAPARATPAPTTAPTAAAPAVVRPATPPPTVLDPGEPANFGHASPTDVGVSCATIATTSQCLETLAGTPQLGHRLAQALDLACQTVHGVVGREACPEQNRVYTCDYNNGNTRRLYYSTGALHFTAATAQAHCQRFRELIQSRYGTAAHN